MNMLGFYASTLFSLLILGVLIAAVLSIFDANKRNKELENRLIEVQEDLQTIKSVICQQKTNVDTRA